MLLIPRVILGVAFLQVVRLAHHNAAAAPMTGDLANAGYLALAVLLAVANAAVWAPALGARLAGPLTGVFTEGSDCKAENRVVRLLRFCRKRGARRWALALALCEGVRHPERPTAFLLGLRTAQPGSWLERLFAAELWRFDNLRNCVLAYRVLQRHGLDPRPHPNQEVNLALMALEQEPRPAASPLPLTPSGNPPVPPRNRRIRLFDAADAMDSPEGSSSCDAGAAAAPSEAAPVTPPLEHAAGAADTSLIQPERGAS